METQEKKLNVFIPIDENSLSMKSQQDEDTEVEKDFYVSGYGSTPNVDLQGETVRPEGIEIDTIFLRQGFVNYEHDHEKLIGVPTENCYVDKDYGLYIEAKLFKDDPYAKKMIDLAKHLKKANVNRNLGFSIEGIINKRNTNDNSIIESVTITGVALTASPANQESTWDYFMKSLQTGYETSPDTQVDGAAIRRESLANSITFISNLMNEYSSKEIATLMSDTTSMLEKDNKMDYETSILTLQIAKGISRRDAESTLLRMRQEQLTGTNKG